MKVKTFLKENVDIVIVTLIGVVFIGAVVILGEGIKDSFEPLFHL